MRIIAIANQKGGCGKTTTAINLSACLAFLQKKVLLIDLDPQGHSTCGLGIKAEFLERTSYDLLQSDVTKIEDIRVAVTEQLFVIPTHVVLNHVEQELSAKGEEAHGRLKARLTNLTDSYDYVVIDLPPNLGFLSFNALTAAEEVIIPMEPSFFSLHGLAKIFETIDALNRRRVVPLRLHALMTRFDKRAKLSREVYEEVRKHFQDQMFHHVIHENIRLREAAASGKSIVDLDRESAGFKDYMGLSIEVIERGLLWHESDAHSVTQLEEASNIVQESSVPAEQDSQQKIELEAPEIEGALETEETAEDDRPGIELLADSNEGATEPDSTNEKLAKTEEPQASAVEIPEEPKENGVAHADPNACAPRTVLGGTLFSFVSREANTVMVAGDFNRWVAEPLAVMDAQLGLWQKVINVEAGTHHYKFLVDDNWRTDPFNQTIKPNPYGGFDSIIKVTNAVPLNDSKKEAETGTA